MGFPESVLTSDERVVLHLHPHWKALIWPVCWLVLALAAVVTVLVLAPDPVLVLATAVVALFAIAVLSFWPWLRWRTTHYVFTNERVILREGVLSRLGRDIPLGRVNDVSFTHGPIERLLGCGTLTIESVGERGQIVLGDLPGVEKTQSLLYELVDDDRRRHSFDDADRDAIVQGVRAEHPKDERPR
ncbi:MAG TPA: PH domain-containing protein [Micromonosporaceae bacterium]|nr:PH domain-containing protein [Micromonosporaceae bacterium]